MGFYPFATQLQQLATPPGALSIASFGARPATIVADAAIVSGSAICGSVSGGFANAVQGQAIMVAGAGATVGTVASTLCTTIAAVNSPTSVTLAANAGNTTTSPNGAIYGPDCTAAIRACIAAAASAATTGTQATYNCEVYTPPGAWMVAGAAVTTGLGNAQIPLPLIAAGGRKLIISFTGGRDSSHLVYFSSNLPQVAGSCWVCPRNDGTTYATAPTNMSSILGGPTPVNGYGAGTSLFNNILPLVAGLSFSGPWNGSYCATDFSCCAEANYESASAIAFASPAQMASNSSASMTNFTPAFAFPGTNNNDDSNAYKISVEGWSGYGIMPSEHTYIASARVIYCYSGIVPNGWTSGAMPHSMLIDYVSVEQSQVCVNFGLTQGLTMLDINQLDSELATSYVTDAGNNWLGTVRCNNFGGIPTKSGGANGILINLRTPPGVWAGAPAAPASGVAQANTSGRYATVWISSTVAITATAVDGTSIGATAAIGVAIPVPVPPDHTYTVTAAGGAQTTKWVLA